MQESLFYEMFKRAERFSLEDFTDEEVQEEGIEVPELTEQEFAQEGIIKAIAGDIGSVYDSMKSEFKGWSMDVAAKRKHIDEKCLETIKWLKNEDKDNPRLNLDMGKFKTWLKSSETFAWRYYYVLNDEIYNDMMKAIKNNENTRIESTADLNMKDRTKVARMLDRAAAIKDLIVIVEKYRARVNILFEGLLKRKRSLEGYPYQVLLLGETDLSKTVKKIVNLAT